MNYYYYFYILFLNKFLLVKKKNIFLKRKSNFYYFYFNNYSLKKYKQKNFKYNFLNSSNNFLYKIIDYKKFFYKYLLINKKVFKFFTLFNKNNLFFKCFLKKLNKNNNLMTFSVLNNMIFKILISAKFIYSYSDFFYLFRNKLIYVNNKKIDSIFIFLKKYDNIQVFINKYYIYYLLTKFKNTVNNIYKFKWKHLKKNNIFSNKFFNSKFFKNIVFLNNNSALNIEVNYYLYSIIVLDNISLKNNFYSFFTPLLITKLLIWRI